MPSGPGSTNRLPSICSAEWPSSGRAGETLFEHAAGLAHRGHRVPVTVETRFQVASVTKMITAATALKMVEEGALSLDRPLTGYLPPDHRPASLDDRHTLHHLLSHTSGLPNYHDDEDETWASFMGALDRIPASRARGPLDVLPLFADLPAVDDFGEFRYCDANYVLAGILIEWVSGRPFKEVARDKVLDPAGMTPFRVLRAGPGARWLRHGLHGRPTSQPKPGGRTPTASPRAPCPTEG